MEAKSTGGPEFTSLVGRTKTAAVCAWMSESTKTITICNYEKTAVPSIMGSDRKHGNYPSGLQEETD
jgi:hypothetical protein